VLNIRTVLMAFWGLYFFACTGHATEGHLVDNQGTESLASSNSSLQVQSSAVVTHQSVNQVENSTETLYSINIALDYRVNELGLAMMLEQSSRTKTSGANDYFPLANSDAGTTTKRTQLSEMFIYGSLEEQQPGWQFGLAEVTTLIDNSEIANDEDSQFLSAGLLNNMTIMFPDYAISARFQDLKAFGNKGYRLIISSGAGMAENEGSYSDLLSIGSSGKGVFSAVELVTQGKNYQAKLGVWQNTHPEAAQTGVYIGMDVTTQVVDVNFRYGQLTGSANANQLSEDNVDEFFAVAFHKEIAGVDLGLGYNISRHQQVIYASSKGTFYQAAEAYYRMDLENNVFITASLQWIASSQERDVWLPTLRLEVLL
jgi:hypothetical protein